MHLGRLFLHKPRKRTKKTHAHRPNETFTEVRYEILSSYCLLSLAFDKHVLEDQLEVRREIVPSR